mgnify:CR=1 FL=1
MGSLVRHARFFDSVVESGIDLDTESVTQTRMDRKRDVTELWVLTRDRDGLFADLTLAISASGASVSGARLNTSRDGLVMNVFYLHSSEGMAFGRNANHQLEVLRKQSLKAAQGDISGLSVPGVIRSRRAGAIPMRPRTHFIDTKSGEQTIVEIQGRDRPGLLHALASLFHETSLDVQSAHIEVVGTMAIDAFYVSGKLTEPQRKSLRKAMLKILRDPHAPPKEKVKDKIKVKKEKKPKASKPKKKLKKTP